MTRVDFYILPEAGTEARLGFACRVVHKAFLQGHRVLVHADGLDTARRMDQLLWTFRQDSFVPHLLEHEAEREEWAPVHIACAEEPWPEADVLVNLGLTVPQFFSRFERIIEVVSQDTETRDAARESFKFYRDRGYPLNTHDLRNGTP